MRACIACGDRVEAYAGPAICTACRVWVWRIERERAALEGGG